MDNGKRSIGMDYKITSVNRKKMLKKKKIGGEFPRNKQIHKIKQILEIKIFFKLYLRIQYIKVK